MIRGVVTAVPRVAQRIKDERFAQATGIYQRYIARPEQNTLTLAIDATRALLSNDMFEPEAIITVTQTPPIALPGMSHYLAHEVLQLGRKDDLFNIDVNAACPGFIYAARLASTMPVRHVLIVAGDCTSKLTQTSDPGTANLFSDAVSAVHWENCGKLLRDEWLFGSDGRGFTKLMAADNTLKMDGAEVFAFALREVPPMVRALNDGAQHNWNPQCTIDWHLFHQANGFMLAHLTKKCKLPGQQVPSNLRAYGNTSSASIPLLICDSSCSEDLRRNTRRVGLYGFGAGWSWGGMVTTMGPLKIAEVIEC